MSPPLYKALGIYLPLITTNCAILGIALIAVRNEYNAIESFVSGIAAGIGFLLALLLMSTIREKLDFEWVPKPFRGAAIAFVTGGLMALAFMAFDKALLRNILGG
jgi:electron transport complex protein RnfA